MVDSIFRRDGDLFVPTEFAASPWSAGALHGGPPAGLLARCAEAHVNDPGMQLARLTIDLFRAVPMAPLAVRTETVRGGRRLCVVQASIIADGVEVARASALFLRPDPDAQVAGIHYPTPVGLEGLEVRTGIRRPTPKGVAPEPVLRPGFHSFVEFAWGSALDEKYPIAWMRIPVPFVEGEETTPVTRTAALSDFANALAYRYAPNEGAKLTPLSYINTDITLYLDRNPEGEWLCLQADHRDEIAGVGLVETIWYDARGRWGRALSARLANQAERPAFPEPSST